MNRLRQIRFCVLRVPNPDKEQTGCQIRGVSAGIARGQIAKSLFEASALLWYSSASKKESHQCRPASSGTALVYFYRALATLVNAIKPPTTTAQPAQVVCTEEREEQPFRYRCCERRALPHQKALVEWPVLRTLH